MADVVLYGPAYSAYTRTARLALIEKGVVYRLEEVDFAGGKGMPAEHMARHPFGKVPVLGHGDVLLYETTAICRYVDAAFDGPALQPVEPRALARMAQVVAVLDSYLSQPIRMGLASELVFKPLYGHRPDVAVVAGAEAAVAHGLAALDALITGTDHIVGDVPSLADAFAAPLIDYLTMCPDGVRYLDPAPRLAAWWATWRMRPSVVETRPDLSGIGRR
ncbi:MAG TPA: glutathione S-transferase family protein [Alphaproteobacteria bacterium]|jgi:glutathione S-transferase|nr:glutathione S-transferase family protein [Alphaproteobacteria bacterium]